MSLDGRRRGKRGGGHRGGGGGGYRCYGSGRGSGGGFNIGADFGPPREVMHLCHFVHKCESDLVCKADIDDVPFFNAPVYFESKQVIGKICEILGRVNEYWITIRPNEGIATDSFNEGDKLYIDPKKIMPLSRFKDLGNGRGSGGGGIGGSRGRRCRREGEGFGNRRRGEGFGGRRGNGIGGRRGGRGFGGRGGGGGGNGNRRTGGHGYWT